MFELSIKEGEEKGDWFISCCPPYLAKLSACSFQLVISDLLLMNADDYLSGLMRTDEWWSILMGSYECGNSS